MRDEARIDIACFYPLKKGLTSATRFCIGTAFRTPALVRSCQSTGDRISTEPLFEILKASSETAGAPDEL
jgi:hypothetical protein